MPIHNPQSHVQFVTAQQGQVSWTFMGAPLQIQLSSLGMADSLILMVLALVVFGPRRLPQIGRQIGKLMYEFRKASNDFKFQMEEELRLSEDADRKKKEEAARAALTATTVTIEAGANTAVVSEQALLSAESTVSIEPAPNPDESTYPTQYSVETPATPVESESHVTLPRTVPVIQPPSTGEQVPAAPPNSVASAQAVEKSDAEGGGGVNPRITPAESPSASAAEGQDEAPGHNINTTPDASTTPPQDPTPSETVSHHG